MYVGINILHYVIIFDTGNTLGCEDDGRHSDTTLLPCFLQPSAECCELWAESGNEPYMYTMMKHEW